MAPQEDPRLALRRALTDSRTTTMHEISYRPVIVLWPDPWFGETVWGLEDAATKNPPAHTQVPRPGEAG